MLTIDALNQSLARRLPVLSGLGAGLGIDEEGRELYEEAAERLLTHLPADDLRVAEAVAILLEHLDNNVGRLIGLVSSMLARREAWLPVLPASIDDYGQAGEARLALEAARAAIVQDHLAGRPKRFLQRCWPQPATLPRVRRRAAPGGQGFADPRLARGVRHDMDDVAHWRNAWPSFCSRARAIRARASLSRSESGRGQEAA